MNTHPYASLQSASLLTLYDLYFPCEYEERGAIAIGGIKWGQSWVNVSQQESVVAVVVEVMAAAVFVIVKAKLNVRT
jgi:hypothetical protein